MGNKMLSLLKFLNPTRYLYQFNLQRLFFQRAQTITSSTHSGTNTSDEELGMFRKLSAFWWDKNSSFKLLHLLNECRIPLIRDGLKSANPEGTSSQPLKNLKILDVGCGGGILSEPLARLGAIVTGLDPVSENISMAQQNVSSDPEIKDRINYVCGTIEDLKLTDQNKYDAVVASEVIEHVPDVDAFVLSCVSVVKNGGSLFFTTINKTQASYWLAIVAAENILKLVPKGVHHWEQFVIPSDLENLLKAYNCVTRLVHGMYYNPITNRWNFTKNTSVNYALHAIKTE